MAEFTEIYLLTVLNVLFLSSVIRIFQMNLIESTELKTFLDSFQIILSFKFFEKWCSTNAVVCRFHRIPFGKLY